MESSRNLLIILGACFLFLLIKFTKITGEMDHCYITIDEYTSALHTSRHETEKLRHRLQEELKNKQQSILDLEICWVKYDDGVAEINEKAREISAKEDQIFNLEDTLRKFQYENDYFQTQIEEALKENALLRKKLGVFGDGVDSKDMTGEEAKSKVIKGIKQGKEESMKSKLAEAAGQKKKAAGEAAGQKKKAAAGQKKKVAGEAAGQKKIEAGEAAGQKQKVAGEAASNDEDYYQDEYEEEDDDENY